MKNSQQIIIPADNNCKTFQLSDTYNPIQLLDSRYKYICIATIIAANIGSNSNMVSSSHKMLYIIVFTALEPFILTMLCNC